MKQINTYIVEKLQITKNSFNTIILDAIFTDVEELINTLNEYFASKLKKPIKFADYKLWFSGAQGTHVSSQEVCGYFIMLFKDDTVVRCGTVLGGKRLLMQYGVIEKGKQKYLEPLIEFENGYNFNQDNFEQWLSKLSNNEYPLLKNVFLS